jgi:hypothetical protein
MTHRNCENHWDTLHIETRSPYKFVKQSHVYRYSRSELKRNLRLKSIFPHKKWNHEMMQLIVEWNVLCPNESIYQQESQLIHRTEFDRAHVSPSEVSYSK